MHPFYGPSGRILSGQQETAAGLVSMAAYLAFWAGVVGLAWREYRTWRPAAEHRSGSNGDAALEVLRIRFARGEIDQEQFLAMHRTLARVGRSNAP